MDRNLLPLRALIIVGDQGIANEVGRDMSMRYWLVRSQEHLRALEEQQGGEFAWAGGPPTDMPARHSSELVEMTNCAATERIYLGLGALERARFVVRESSVMAVNHLPAAPNTLSSCMVCRWTRTHQEIFVAFGQDQLTSMSRHLQLPPLERLPGVPTMERKAVHDSYHITGLLAVGAMYGMRLRGFIR